VRDIDVAQIRNKVYEIRGRRVMLDFMFQLSLEEWELVAKCDRFPKRIKHSSIAIRANINIMRAFVAVREYLLTHASESVELAQLRERVSRLEQTSDTYAESIDNLYHAIDELAAKPSPLDPNRRLIRSFKKRPAYKLK
jgi:DNA repair ATPase RecN